MSKAAYRSLVWTLPLTLALGCATNSSDRRVSRAEMFESMPAAAMTATSDRPAQRVYPEQPINGIITPSMAPPAGASEADWAIAQNIRGTLTADRSLAPYPSEVQATVDKNAPGTVRLRGTIVNPQERDRLHNTISQLPGVTTVDDQLVVAGSPPHGALDSRIDVNK